MPTSTLTGTFDNRARVTAPDLATSDVDVTEVVDGRSYRVVRTVATTMASGADTSSCIGSTGSARQTYKRVSTRVTPGFRGGVRPVRADTLVEAPVFDPHSASGAIAVVVLDRSGLPLAGLSVTVGISTLTTNAKGCAFFDGLLPGTHVVTVTRNGSVKVDGSTVLSRSVVVAAGQITGEALRVDIVATTRVVSRAFGTSSPADFQLPTGLEVHLATPTRDVPSRVVDPKTVTGADLLFPVFPEVGGYEASHDACLPPVRTPSEPGTSPTRRCRCRPSPWS